MVLKVLSRATFVPGVGEQRPRRPQGHPALRLPGNVHLGEPGGPAGSAGASEAGI